MAISFPYNSLCNVRATLGWFARGKRIGMAQVGHATVCQASNAPAMKPFPRVSIHPAEQTSPPLRCRPGETNITTQKEQRPKAHTVRASTIQDPILFDFIVFPRPPPPTLLVRLRKWRGLGWEDEQKLKYGWHQNPP